MRKQLSKSEIKNLNEQIQRYGFEINKKDRVEKNDEIIIINNEPCFFYYEEKPIPTLKLDMRKNLLKKITVDMGAIKFVTNGADIMRPGIVNIEDGIEKDDIITIIDINNKKQLSVGKALLNSQEMKNETKGRVIQNLHYVGDNIWNS